MIVSPLQRFCCSIILHCCFKEVVILNYRGGLTSISVDKIAAKNDKAAFELKDFKLEWHPWKLLFGRELNVTCLQGYLNLNCKKKAADKLLSYKAGWQVSPLGANKNTFSFLKKMQFPVKLNIDTLDVGGSGFFNELQVDNIHVILKNVKPEQAGEGQYTAMFRMPLNAKDLSVQVQGDLQVFSNKKNLLSSVKCSGKVNLSADNKKYPRIIYTLSVEGKDSSPQEHLKFALHCGQANDFTLVGESFKTTDYAYNFKWQGVFDHSLLKIFFPEYTPVLSLLAEGDCFLRRKDLTWGSHTYLSAWAKHLEALDPSLKMIPSLNFKAKFDADFDSNSVCFKQYKISVKEKGAQRLFFDLNSLQALTYRYKTGFEKPKKDVQLAEINFYEIPFEIFNPYLQKYKCQIRGCLNTGTLNFAWDEHKNQWNISTLQPLAFHIQHFDVDKKNVVSDVDGHIKEKLYLQQDMSKVEFDTNILLTDTKFMPFFEFIAKGHIGSNSSQISGSIDFNHRCAEQLLHLENLDCRLHPDLCFKGEYSFSSKSDKILFNTLNLSASSASENKKWLTLNLWQPVSISCKNEIKFDREGQIITLKADRCPVNLVEAGKVSLKGEFSCDSELVSKENAVNLIATDPLKITDLKVGFQQQDWVNITQAQAKLQGNYLKKKWHCDLEDVSVLMDKDALFSGYVKLAGNDSKIKTSEGQFKLQLDSLSMQPFALKYPGLVGEVSGHWDFADKRKVANGHANVGCVEFPLNMDVKMAYEFDPTHEHHWKGIGELRDKDHVSDLNVDLSVKKDGVFNGHIVSEKMFLKDVLATIFGVKKVSEALIKAKPETTDVALNARNEAETKQEIPVVGTCDFNFKSMVANDVFLKGFTGLLDVNKESIALKNIQGELCEGRINGHGKYFIEKSDAKVEWSFNGENMQLSQLWDIPSALNYPLDRYGQLAGTLRLGSNGECSLNSMQSLRGQVSAKITDGYYKAISNASLAGQAVSGLTTTLGLVLGANFSGMSNVGFLTSYLRAIPFKSLDLDVQRLTDEQVVAKTALLNDDFAFYTDNQFLTQPGKFWQNQPFVSQLWLNASKASPLMNYFDFDEDLSDGLGYCPGPKCTIDGTLGKPNYAALLNIIVNKKNRKEVDNKSPVQQLLRQLF